MVRVTVDQGVNLKQLQKVQDAGWITLHQAHDLEQRFRKVQPQGRAATYGTSTYGGPDMYAGPKFDETLKIVGRENTVDAHHVYAAHLNRDGYFITENVNHFISGGRRERLESLLGVKIRRTEEFVAEITSSPASEKKDD